MNNLLINPPLRAPDYFAHGAAVESPDAGSTLVTAGPVASRPVGAATICGVSINSSGVTADLVDYQIEHVSGGSPVATSDIPAALTPGIFTTIFRAALPGDTFIVKNVESGAAVNYQVDVFIWTI
jgi:hypothetical protein